MDGHPAQNMQTAQTAMANRRRGGAFTTADEDAARRTVGVPEEDALFHMDAPPPVSLADRFGVPPFSVLDRRGGVWQDRKRRWLSLGIRSEVGRADSLAYAASADVQHTYTAADSAVTPGGRGTNSVYGGNGAKPGTAERIMRFLEDGTLDGKTPKQAEAARTPGPAGSMTSSVWMHRTDTGGLSSSDEKWRDSTLAGAEGREGDLTRAPYSVRDPAYYEKKSGLEGRIGREVTHDEMTRLYEVGLLTHTGTGTSVFDPVLCELVYRWFSAPGHRVIDPFAGGSVRGVVASILGRHYAGIDLRGEQIAANRQQWKDIAPKAGVSVENGPRWFTGDSHEILDRWGTAQCDLVFSCPPYADLEVYSDDPRDLSTMEYNDFAVMHGEIIAKACARLREDRFACWVISDVRDKRGIYRGLEADTIRAFEKAGLKYYNDAVILDAVGSAAVRAARTFLGARKLVRMHQHLFVFVKGDPKAATLALGDQGQIIGTGGDI